MKRTTKLLNLIIKVKKFTYRLCAKNLLNIIPYLIMCFTPFGLITWLLSGRRLFGSQGIRYLLNPLWIITLSSLIVRRRNNGYLECISPFKRIKFLAQDWDAIYIYFHIWISRDYEKITKPKGVVIDSGAHIGLFALRCLKALNTHYVVVIEPNPSNIRLLYLNLFMNEVSKKCLIVEAAAGSTTKQERELYIHNLSGRSSIVKRTAKSIKVKEVSLNDLTLTLKKIDFIKIDVEDAELEVLKGALDTIRRDKPILIIETSEKNLPELKELLGKYYKFYLSPLGGLHMVCVPDDL